MINIVGVRLPPRQRPSVGLVSTKSCYGSIPLIMVLIGRDDDLNTLCHSCRFDYQQRVLKMFSGPGHIRCENGEV